MATRRLGGLDLDRAVELAQRLPLDARDLARTKEEMLDPGSYVYGYNGMVVTCREEQKRYMLIDQNNPTLPSAWKDLTPDVGEDIQPISNAEIDEIIYG